MSTVAHASPRVNEQSCKNVKYGDHPGFSGWRTSSEGSLKADGRGKSGAGGKLEEALALEVEDRAMYCRLFYSFCFLRDHHPAPRQIPHGGLFLIINVWP